MIALDTNILVYAYPGPRSGPKEARDFLFAMIVAGAKVIRQSSGFGERLAQLACDLDVSGVRIFDLQIALTAQEGGAHEIWTHDRTFTTVPGLKIFDPL
jgi:predicted nucleic acid-binding protein